MNSIKYIVETEIRRDKGGRGHLGIEKIKREFTGQIPLVCRENSFSYMYDLEQEMLNAKENGGEHLFYFEGVTPEIEKAGNYGTISSELNHPVLKVQGGLVEEHRELMYRNYKEPTTVVAKRISEIESELNELLRFSGENTMFDIFKEEYQKLLSESVKGIDVESRSFRTLVRKNLKKRFKI